MKHVLILFAVLITSMASAQKYFTKTGVTEFKASVDAFEPVEAENKSTTAILNIATGDIAALLFVKAFHFEIALMQEHFNENYMDSDKHPKATFKGKIIDFNTANLSEKETAFTLKGTLTIKGVAKPITTAVQIKKVAEKLVLDAEFAVSPSDFNIKIPSIVRKKIAKSITIKLDYELIEKK